MTFGMMPTRSPIRTRLAAFDFVNPDYWKQQWYLAGVFKEYLPTQISDIIVMELAPVDGKLIGYIAPDEDMRKQYGCRLDMFLALGSSGSSSAQLTEFMKQQGTINKVGTKLIPWQPGKKTEEKYISKETIDLAVVNKGTSASLGIKQLGQGLAEMRRLLTPNGRMLILTNKDDEKILGGSLGDILASQDSEELADLVDESGASMAKQTVGAQLLRNAGLLLVKNVPDDCGLSMGVAVKRDQTVEAKAVPRAVRRKRAREQAAKASGTRDKPGRRQKSGY